MKTSFSIIIVTWNALEHLKRFLPSVAATEYSEFEIIIADNASSDGSAKWVHKHYPHCRVVTFDKNYGYCGGNNRAVKYAAGEVLVFLNNDVEADPGWLSALDRTFSKAGADIAQPKLRSVENREFFEYAGAAGGMLDWLGYPFCRGRIFDTVEPDTGQYDQRSEIFWASGAAFAIRKQLFLESGGFDEDFEFHMEEIDLCWRCLRRGARILYEPGSLVYHLGGGSLPMGSPRKVFYNYRNSLMMLTKNVEGYLLFKIIYRLILDGAAGLRSLFQGKPAETWAIIRAHFACYRMLPAILSKRKTLRRQANRSCKHRLYPRLVVFQYFLKGRKTYHELSR